MFSSLSLVYVVLWELTICTEAREDQLSTISVIFLRSQGPFSWLVKHFLPLGFLSLGKLVLQSFELILCIFNQLSENLNVGLVISCVSCHYGKLLGECRGAG